MSRWVTGKELMKDWQIKEIELFDIVQNGLQPHNALGKPIHSPDVAEKIERLENYENHLKWLNVANNNANTKFESSEVIKARNTILNGLPILIDELKQDLSKYNKYSWYNYDLPNTIEEANKIFDLLKGYLYSEYDVTNYKKSIKNKLPHKVIAFLSDLQFYKEVEMLYAVFKKVGLSSEINYLLESCIEFIRQNTGDFTIIKDNYLDNLEILSINEGKEKRDIISSILHAVVKGKGWGDYSKHRLLLEYNRQTDKIPTKKIKHIIK